MKIKPILFSTIMVQAILDGTKTQTRRIVKGEALDWLENSGFDPSFVQMEENGLAKCFPGDVFWVRETWAEAGNFASDAFANSEVIAYKTKQAFFYENGVELDTFAWNWNKIKWKPSIFMPKDVCRIFLECKNVRIERLLDISEEDAKAEGVKSCECPTTKDCVSCLDECQSKGEYYDYMDLSGETFPKVSARESFFSLWESINGKDSLDSDPWVWVYDFEITEKPANFIK